MTTTVAIPVAHIISDFLTPERDTFLPKYSNKWQSINVKLLLSTATGLFALT
jgi:hypothetical protein